MSRLVQIGSNWFKLVQICPNCFKFIQISSNLNISKLDQIGSNFSDLVQTYSLWFKHVWSGSKLSNLVRSKLSNLVQIGSNWLKHIQACLFWFIFVWLDCLFFQTFPNWFNLFPIMSSLSNIPFVFFIISNVFFLWIFYYLHSFLRLNFQSCLYKKLEIIYYDQLRTFTII